MGRGARGLRDVELDVRLDYCEVLVLRDLDIWSLERSGEVLSLEGLVG